MKVKANGPRYYPDEMKNFSCAVDAIKQLNNAKMAAYDAAWRHAVKPDPSEADRQWRPYRTLRNDWKLPAFYANAMETTVTGIIKSQESNKQNYISKAGDDLARIRDKISSKEAELSRKQAVKKAIRAYAKTGVWNAPYPKCTLHAADRVISGWKVELQPVSQYEYAVEDKIRRLKANIAYLKDLLARKASYLEKLKASPIPRAVFGSKKLLRKKDTAPYPGWKEDFDFARHHSITIAGRADSCCGNYIVQYDEITGDLVWHLPHGKDAVFPHFKPAIYTAEFLANMKDGNEAHRSVGYTIERRIDGNGKEYLLVSACLTLPPNSHANFDISTGVIACDTNADCLAWADLDGKSIALSTGTIPMELQGLTSNQAKDAIGRAVSILVAKAVSAKKPIVREDLESKHMKVGMRYQPKTRNRAISAFACERVVQTIMSKAYKNSVGVFAEDPAYTSFEGKVCAMRPMGRPVHEAAAVMIGRRCLGCESDVPAKYRKAINMTPSKRAAGNLWAEKRERWKRLYNALKDVRTHAFYLDIPENLAKKQLLAWIKEHDVPKRNAGYA